MAKSLRLAACLIGAALLSGCSSVGFEGDDVYTGSTYTDRYPIKVAKAPMKLEVSTSKAGLQASQIDAIVNFSRSAQMASVSRVLLQRPSGGGASSSVARQVYNILVQNGVEPKSIDQGTYRASARAPVVISFTRAVAITKECGDWSSDLANTPDNQPYSNFGCAIQQNTAAMIQDPTDLEVPTPTDPVNAPYRIKMKDLFVKLD